jgi:phospholipase C
VLRFLEVFLAGKTSPPVVETNISAWRRTICGDLTSAFGTLADAGQGGPQSVERDSFVEGIHRAGFGASPGSHRSLTAEEVVRIRENARISPLLPVQEPGTRPSRSLPYELHAEGRLDRWAGTFAITFEAAASTFGKKSLGAPFQVYAPGAYRSDEPIGDSDARLPDEHARRWSFAVAAGDRISYAWPLEEFEGELYHLRTYGPNGFHREYRGNASDPLLEIGCTYMEKSESLLLSFLNQKDGKPIRITVTDLAYGAGTVAANLPPGEAVVVPFDLTRSFRWYDLEVAVEGCPLFSRRYAGRVENGKDGQSDPLIGRRAAAIANDAGSRQEAKGSTI